MLLGMAEPLQGVKPGLGGWAVKGLLKPLSLREIVGNVEGKVLGRGGGGGHCRSGFVCTVLHPALQVGEATARVPESAKDTNPRCPFLPASSSL